jgi:PKD repeat protein
MALPNRIGYVTADSGGEATFTITLTPDGTIAEDDWMIAVLSWVTGTGTDHTISGWTQIGTKSVTGTLSTCIYKRKRAAGDTSYALRTTSNSVLYTASLQWFRDVADTGWVEGVVGTREDAADDYTTAAPGITTVSTDNLVVSFFTERTLTDEPDISSINGASKWYFKGQNSISTCTITAGYNEKVIAGTVPAASVLYPNNQPSNGSAIQIALPSVTSLPAPTSAFTYGGSFLNVTLDASTSVDGNGTIVSYQWNFGDGNTGSGVTTSHTYAVPGTYSITLTIEDNDGIQSTNTQSVTVSAAPNNAPTASFLHNQTDLQVSVDASNSTDGDGTITGYSWNFGDGNTGSGVTASHTYAVPGTYTVTLTVTDDDGAIDTNPQQVTVTAPAGWATIVGNSNFRSPNNTTSTELILTPDGTIVDDMWMIAVITYHEAPITTITPPAGWTLLNSQYTMGTSYGAIYAKQRVTGETSYTFTLGTAKPSVGTLTWVDNAAALNTWTVGNYQLRSGSNFDNIAPPITTTSTNNLIFAASVERTNAAEADISSITGATKVHFLAQVGTTQPANTILIASTQKATLGTTDPVTITYPNTQATNGIAIQIGIPPFGTVINAPPVAAFTHSITALDATFNATSSSDSDGTITTYDWDFGDGNTGSGASPSHSYASPGTYGVTLTVTDNSGATDSVSHNVIATAAAAVPVRVGYVTADNGNNAGIPLTLTPDGSIADGMWMIAVISNVVSGTPTHTPPSGWTQIGSYVPVGTTYSSVWKRKRTAGDTDYVFSVTNLNNITGALMWFTGVADTGWIEGTQALRAATGTSFTNVAPGVTTVSTNNLIITISGERTTAAEADISSMNNADPWFFKGQNSNATCTLSVGYSTMASPGTTADVTITYPNTQATNGWAGQIALPPIAANIPPLASFTVSGTYLARSFDASASSDSDGTIALYDWNFGDGNTGTGVTVNHTYAGEGTYIVVLNVTDNLGATSSTNTMFTASPQPPEPSIFVWDGTSELPATTTIYNGTSEEAESGIELAVPNYTVANLLSTTPFYIGHRGSGQVWPEHTLEAYVGAMEAGAKAIELSVHKTVDGVWVCHHDLNTNRMTGQSYEIKDTPYATIAGLSNIGSQTLLGSDSSTPPIPLLSDVLDKLWGKVVLFVECKSGTAANIDEMFGSVLPARGSDYADRVVSKSHQTNAYASSMPRTMGYKAWVYMNQTFTDNDLAGVVARADYLGVPTYPYSGSASSDADVSRLVATGLPVIGWEMWYKWQTTKYLALGIRGFMSSCLPYSSRGPRRTQDNFVSNKRMAGDYIYHGNSHAAMGTGVLTMPNQITAQLMASMHLPVSDGYAIDFEMQWATVAGDATLHHGIAFCKDDDKRYRFGVTPESPGYHLVLRRNGELQLYRHTTASGTGISLSSVISTTPISSTSTWVHIRVEVSATTITFQRLDDGSSATIIGDATHRGKFFWLCQNNTTDRIKFRDVRVSLL